jgi:hypothetical protein
MSGRARVTRVAADGLGSVDGGGGPEAVALRRFVPHVRVDGAWRAG